MNRIKRALNEGYKILENDLREHMGKSKHKEKQEAREKGLPANRIRGLRSPQDLKTYKSYLKTFINREGPKNRLLKHIWDYQSVVALYLQKLVDDYNAGTGYSSTTIGTIASALAATFKCSKNSFGIQFPKRRASEIKNSRKPVKSDSLFMNLDKYGDAFNMSLAVGARKGGLIKLSVGDIRKDKFGGYEVFLDEKSGKTRWSKVLPDLADRVIKIMNNPKGPHVNGKLRIFDKHDIPSGTHEWRAAYCANLYRFYEKLIKEGIIKKPQNKNSKSEYYCMKGDRKGEILDRWILIKISINIGHGKTRTSLIANNYIRKGFGFQTLAYLEYNELKSK